MSYKKFSDPYETSAKFNSTCSDCKKPIKKGNPIVYDKFRSLVYCKDCGKEIIQATNAAKSFDNYGTDIY